MTKTRWRGTAENSARSPLRAAGCDTSAPDATQSTRELRRRGFGGLIVIQSANDGLNDERSYLEAGADGSIGKAVKGGATKILSVLGRLWQARFRDAGGPHLK